MKRGFISLNCLAAAVALGFAFPADCTAKGYSSGGGHSYSSSSSHSSSFSSHSSSSGGSHSFSSGSSHSFSSGGGGSSRSSSSGGGSYKSFSSGSGKSYTSGSGTSGERKGYSSTKSYSSGSGTKYSSGSGSDSSYSKPPARPLLSSGSVAKPSTGSGSSGLTFDSSAARARKEEASKSDFSRFKESQNPSATARSSGGGSYSAKPPPIPSSNRSYGRTVYVPDVTVIRTRPARINVYFGSYGYRPWIYYHDPYSSLFWWWLLDRSIDEQAWWAYHHRYDMDPNRYQALIANNQQLEARVNQLEAQQVARDPSYTPPSLEPQNRDLMYSDQYVNQAYQNRPTTSGKVAFWVVAVPACAGACGFFIWLIWFKRWQTPT